MRPIVSTIDGPASQLAILLDDILKPLAESEFDIKYSIEFTDKLKGVKLTEDEILASLDIITLFPNTPMNEVKTIILKRWDEVREQTKMSQQLFTDIFDFVTKEAAVFTWNETTYPQTHGCAMGVNTSPTFAAIAVNELLKNVIKKLPYTPKIITKYEAIR